MPRVLSVAALRNPAHTLYPVGMSNSGQSRVYIQEGFRWDTQRAYLFDIDGTLLRHRDRIHFDAFYESVREVLGCELVLDGVRLDGNTAAEGRAILRDAQIDTVHPVDTMDEAARRAAELAARG